MSLNGTIVSLNGTDVSLLYCGMCCNLYNNTHTYDYHFGLWILYFLPINTLKYRQYSISNNILNVIIVVNIVIVSLVAIIVIIIVVIIITTSTAIGKMTNILYILGMACMYVVIIYLIIVHNAQCKYVNCSTEYQTIE